MEQSMKKFSDIREQQYPEVRKHLKKVGKDGSFNPSGGIFCGKFLHLRPLPKLDVYSKDRFVNCNKLMTCGS